MKICVLIVEDDLSTRESLKELVEIEGYEAVTAMNGAQAMETVKKLGRHISLILLDFHMPLMDGNAFIEWLDKVEAMDGVAIVGMTAGSLHFKSKKEIICVRKPFDIDEIMALLRKGTKAA